MSSKGGYLAWCYEDAQGIHIEPVETQSESEEEEENYIDPEVEVYQDPWDLSRSNAKIGQKLLEELKRKRKD